MNALQATQLLSPAAYLAWELQTPGKHEYLGGVVHAMAGANARHNRIATSLLRVLGQGLKGHLCEPFNSDMKVRIQLASHVRFYYPDAMVVCQANPENCTYQDYPKVIVEVLSASTRRLDMGEKCQGYLSISSLAVYLMVEQDQPSVIAYRRSEQGFQREVYQGEAAIIDLPEIQCQLPLAEIYDRVQFGPEARTEDE